MSDVRLCFSYGIILATCFVEVDDISLALKIEEITLDTSRIKVFTDLPWHLYRHDRCWTPPLRGDLLGSRLLGLVGLLSRVHPYHSHAEVAHFLA